MTIHQYKDGLEKLCDRFEDLWIEKEAYREYLLRYCMVSESDLARRLLFPLLIQIRARK